MSVHPVFFEKAGERGSTCPYRPQLCQNCAVTAVKAKEPKHPCIAQVCSASVVVCLFETEDLSLLVFPA